MSIALVGDREAASMRLDIWFKIFGLAVLFGWSPSGTRDPKPDYPGAEPEQWDDGDYFTSSGQTVTKEDASNLAAALRAALEAIKADRLSPDHLAQLNDETLALLKNTKFIELVEEVAAIAGQGSMIIG